MCISVTFQPFATENLQPEPLEQAELPEQADQDMIILYSGLGSSESGEATPAEFMRMIVENFNLEEEIQKVRNNPDLIVAYDENDDEITALEVLDEATEMYPVGCMYWWVTFLGAEIVE